MNYHKGMLEYELLADISREIRTPVHTIMGMADLAMEDMDDAAKVRECLQKIKEVSGKLNDRINVLIDAIDSDHDGDTQRVENCTSCELCDTIAVQAAYYLDGRNIDFTIDSNRMIRSAFLTDKRRLVRLLTNLIAHVVRNTPDGGSIAFTATSAPGVRGQVINRYSLVRSGNKPDVAPDDCMDTVRRMTDLMEGKLSQTTLPDGREDITVELRSIISDMVDDKPKPLPEKVNVSMLIGRRILLCEDNIYNAEMTKLFLETAGMLVDCAENGMEAVERVAHTPEYYYDAVLMDIRMPVMDGPEATLRIRALKREDTYVLPIAAMTASDDEEDYRKALAAGMDAYLLKPFSIKTLLQKLVGFWEVYKPSAAGS